MRQDLIPVTVDIGEVIGRGYKNFWFSRDRYRVVKGGRGSKKSCTAALWFIYNMMKYYHEYGLKPHTLVVRRFFNTHKSSTRAQLVWAIHRLKVENFWRIPKGEHTLTYIPSGQTILFRGLDDPQSITSITVEDGQLCWVWWEEAFQIENEGNFDKVDLSIRGETPYPLFKQHTITFNPWSENHWLNNKFFIDPDPGTLSMTTTYECNEFLGEDDIQIFDTMKVKYPRRYNIEGKGNWGIAEGLIFENWRLWNENDPNFNEILQDMQYRQMNGMDFGYNDPTAFTSSRNKKKEFKLYVCHEFCKPRLSNQDIYDNLVKLGYHKSVIIGDSAEARTIEELKKLGIGGLRGAKKGGGSVLAGIQKLQDYEIIVHPTCKDTQVALLNYAWKQDNKTGKTLDEPAHDFSHIPDTLRYGSEGLERFGTQFG